MVFEPHIGGGEEIKKKREGKGKGKKEKTYSLVSHACR